MKNSVLILCFLGLTYFSCKKKKSVNLPNIIVILTDDQRWDAIGYAGNKIIKTPEQDKLAREGTYFNKAFVTTPICGASRASIITGLYERKHNFTLGGTTLDPIYLKENYPVILKKMVIIRVFLESLVLKIMVIYQIFFLNLKFMIVIINSKIAEVIIIKL